LFCFFFSGDGEQHLFVRQKQNSVCPPGPTQ
jgi:hypothetical protein